MVTRERHAIDRHTERMIVLILIGLTLALSVSRVKETAWGSANTKSRIATVESLVHHGTFAIDNSPFNKTMDRVRIDGKLYSSKPPVLPVAMASVYFVLHHTTGLTLRDDRHHSAAHMVLVVIFSAGSLVGLLLFIYALACRLTRSATGRLTAVAATGLGFFGAGYAVDINNHLPAAMVTVAALYYATVVRQRVVVVAREWMLAGFFVGLLPTLDVPSGLAAFAIAAWLVVINPRLALRFALPAALAPVLFHLILTWSYSGGLLPVQLRPETWEPGNSDRGNDSWPVYAWNMLLGHHGILSMVPILVPALWGMVVAIRDRAPEERAARELALVVGPVLILTFLFYSVRTRNYGGVCVGFRWLIPQIAASLVFVAVLIGHLRAPMPRRWVIALALALALGTPHMVNAAYKGPWSKAVWVSVSGEIGAMFRSDDRKPPRKRPKAKPRGPAKGSGG